MLLNEIKKLTEKVYPFHMPGHKRNPEWLEGLYEADITEIYGSDDLHAPSGIIAEAQSRAKIAAHSVSTIFLTGGSTAGILAAVSASVKKGDKILIARNCHKSVYNACTLNDLSAEYIYPAQNTNLGTFGEVLPADIAAEMDKSGAKVVVITSPTYEGITSDIKTISKTVHARGGILIVDSAHGAHLGFNDYFPPSARSLGADIVIESAHKTLPCLTGAALLHICSHRINYGAIQNNLSVFETSSPPYPILCSIDRFFTKNKQSDLFTPYVKRLEIFYKKAEGLKNISVFTSSYMDRSKIIISTKNANINGFELKNILREKYNLELEMAMPEYALAMTSIADTAEGFNRLILALLEIDDSLTPKTKSAALAPKKATIKENISVALQKDFTLLPEIEALGKISGEFIFAYPPGSPIVAPGEVLTGEILAYLSYLLKSGAQIYSSKGEFPNSLAVLEEKD